MNTRSRTNRINSLLDHNKQSSMKTPRRLIKVNTKGSSTTEGSNQSFHVLSKNQLEVEQEPQEMKCLKMNSYFHLHGQLMFLGWKDQECHRNQFLKQQIQFVKSSSEKYLYQSQQIKDKDQKKTFQNLSEQAFQQQQLLRTFQRMKSRQISGTKQSRLGIHQQNTGQFDNSTGNFKPYNLIKSEPNISQDHSAVNLFMNLKNVDEQVPQSMPIKECKEKSMTDKKSHLQKRVRSKNIKKNRSKLSRGITKRDIALVKQRGKGGRFVKNSKAEGTNQSLNPADQKNTPERFQELEQ